MRNRNSSNAVNIQCQHLVKTKTNHRHLCFFRSFHVHFNIKKNSSLIFLSSADIPAPTPRYDLKPTFVGTVIVFFVSVTTPSRIELDFFLADRGGGPCPLPPSLRHCVTNALFHLSDFNQRCSTRGRRRQIMRP